MSSMSPVSSASSPSVEGNPRALAPLAPSFANDLPSLQLHSSGPSSLLTHREWVVPPRPKPGRKPATDTPPTKRKAQNRAAQRAFRERRAAKVGELEEQMKEMEEEDEREQTELRSHIHRLEGDVREYQRVVMEYSQRMKGLETELLEERTSRVAVQRELAGVRGQSLPVDTVPLPPRKKILEQPKAKPVLLQRPELLVDAAMGCGNCNVNTRCECIEQAFDMANLAAEDSNASPKRPRSPVELDHNKRLRYGSVTSIKPEDEVEVDFTTRRLPLLSRSTSQQLTTPINKGFETCGFCDDGTSCLCADLAEDEKNSSLGRSNLSRLLSEPSESSRHSTPTRLSSIARQIPSPATRTSTSCQNGPGSCTQCQTSPTSTLFCKSLAATRCNKSNASTALSAPRPSSSSRTCANPNGCCRGTSSDTMTTPPPPHIHTQHSIRPQPQLSPPSSAPPISGPTLSCADAFTTLSRHPAFDRASDELGVWLPQLATVPKGVEGRTAFEIEAASVMGVLKLFDRRFGRGE
ncbi:hypothetical protein MMC17_008908 [Xylographa soralifera]|nr:hypothetical protein [Xylographa soralifera]